MYRTFRLITAVLFVPVLVVGCSDPDDGLKVVNTTTPGVEQTPAVTHTAHTGPEAGIWPPQPENLSNAVPIIASARDGVLSGVLAAARRSILNNPQMQRRLGSDYREIEATFGDNKSAEVANLVFYNYATDESIDITFGKDASVTSQIFDAEWYQPAENAAEKSDAINLARTVLTDSSFDVTDLEATAMLAFPPLSDIESEQRHFYPQRMLYVTFGRGEGDLPVYSALVNLSTATVTEHGLVK